MRNMLGSSNLKIDKMVYISKTFGVANQISDILSSLLKSNEPILIEDTRIGLLISGEAEVTVNLIDYKIGPGTLVYIGTGSVVQFKYASEDINVKGLVMQDDFMNIALHGQRPKMLDGRQLNFYIKANEKEREIANRMIEMIWDIVHEESYNRETVYGLISALIYYYDGLASKTNSEESKVHSREREIFERFIMLVNANCHKERLLAFYADKLYISERYLGTLVKKASGITAKEWIDRAVITAAKVMLRHSDKQVAQISDELRFPNNSFFCKYFKRLTGVTPMKYRET